MYISFVIPFVANYVRMFEEYIKMGTIKNIDGKTTDSRGFSKNVLQKKC